MFVLVVTGAAHAAPARETVVGIDLAATVHTYDASPAAWGESAFVRVGAMYSDDEHAWAELGGGLRLARFERAGDVYPIIMVDLLAGIRAGLVLRGVRPWIGIYAGIGNHEYHLGDDPTNELNTGLALDAAIGVDYDLPWRLRVGVKVDVASDLSNDTFTWYAVGAGVTRMF
jgi:hypothetical protein